MAEILLIYEDLRASLSAGVLKLLHKTLMMSYSFTTHYSIAVYSCEMVVSKRFNDVVDYKIRSLICSNSSQ